MFDPDRRPTAFQWRVLNLVRSQGPISIAGLKRFFDLHGTPAIRSACWILRSGGYLEKKGDQVDVTAAGRHVLELERKSRRWSFASFVLRYFRSVPDRTDSAASV